MKILPIYAIAAIALVACGGGTDIPPTRGVPDSSEPAPVEAPVEPVAPVEPAAPVEPPAAVPSITP